MRKRHLRTIVAAACLLEPALGWADPPAAQQPAPSAAAAAPAGSAPAARMGVAAPAGSAAARAAAAGQPGAMG
ncbi:MAG TPA: hypothetical protein VK509_19495, partial [Polyangiales bacterium]|nr:hypothetical protein [Polyangiales bacterium]